MMEYLTPEGIKKLATTGNAQEAAERVLTLQTSDKFRLAAALLDVGKPDLAEAVGMRACQEIQLAQLFGGPRAHEQPTTQTPEKPLSKTELRRRG